MCVKPFVALLVKLPPMVSMVEGAVTAPEEESIVKLVVDAAFEPKDFVPAPRKLRLLKAFVEPVIVPLNVCAEEPFKYTVPELWVNMPLFV